MRIAITGRSGQIVQALRERAALIGTTVVPLARPAFDLAADRSLIEPFRSAKPDVIVSAAAYTAVDRAESEPALAHAVNAEAPRRIAEAAAALGVPLIHLSTDYVFDGTKPTPWNETDPTGPLSVYGRTKLMGEKAALEAHTDTAVLRVAWVYSPFGTNFLKTMLRLAETHDEVGVVADQHGSPSSAFDIADALLKIASNLEAAPSNAGLRGLFHMGGSGETTWAGFADAILASRAQRAGGKHVKVRPITTDAYPTAARRPANSRLDSRKLEQSHGIGLPHWKPSLELVLDRLI